MLTEIKRNLFPNLKQTWSIQMKQLFVSISYDKIVHLESHFGTFCFSVQIVSCRLLCADATLHGVTFTNRNCLNPLHWRHNGRDGVSNHLTIVYSTVYSGADQRKHQSSASLAFVRGIHRSPVNSPRKRRVTRKMFPFDDVIMPAPELGHG